METATTRTGTDTDNDLEAVVRDAIMMLDAVRPTRARVHVHVEGGHVTLIGNVQSPMAASEVERTALAVPGVKGVTNGIVDDATLTRQLADTLSRDPRTQDIPAGYAVNANFGRVWVAGYFDDAQAQAIQAVAQTLPAVREIMVRRL